MPLVATSAISKPYSESIDQTIIIVSTRLGHKPPPALPATCYANANSSNSLTGWLRLMEANAESCPIVDGDQIVDKDNGRVLWRKARPDQARPDQSEPTGEKNIIDTLWLLRIKWRLSAAIKWNQIKSWLERARWSSSCSCESRLASLPRLKSKPRSCCTCSQATCSLSRPRHYSIVFPLLRCVLLSFCRCCWPSTQCEADRIVAGRIDLMVSGAPVANLIVP